MLIREKLQSRLWAITCLFNPAGYAVRTQNFKSFRRHLRIPLLAVELAFDTPFALEDSDADFLIQIRGGDSMWQKERLLNIGLQALPAECDQVVWIDADMILPDPRWPQAVSNALECKLALQPYSVVHHLPPTGMGDTSFSWNPSTMAAKLAGHKLESLLDSVHERKLGTPSSGHIWAARREFLGRHGLYDCCIIGGGDNAFLCAVNGKLREAISLHCMGTAQAKRYLDWAIPIFDELKGDVGVLPHEAYHLWHGSLENRHCRERHVGLSKIGFDPFRDIMIGESGAWRWGSERPELHAYVRDYFNSRNEDHYNVG